LRRQSRRVGVVALAAVIACLAWSAAAGASVGGLTAAIKGPQAKKDSGSPTATCVFKVLLGLDCWTPYQISRAYNFPTNLDGAGQTIVIIDAYGNPNMLADLQDFDARYGVPNPAPGNFTVVNGPTITSSGSGDLDGWGVETSLDVEWAHAMAPGAKIVLVRSHTDDDTNITAALQQVVANYPGAIVSQSFGLPEGFSNQTAPMHALYVAGTAKKETFLASAGDYGATWTPILGTTSPSYASYPASDPLVTGVGGTQGNPYSGGLFVNGHYGSEQVWNEPAFDAATGGAPSFLFAAPPWQRPVTPYKTRSVPDVAYNAAIIGGVPVRYTQQVGADAGNRFTFLVGGTSSGSPQWAAIFALVNQARGLQGKGPIGFANESLYKVGKHGSAAFHDITVGTNALDSPLGYPATAGYDASTGLGTPNVSQLLPGLVAAPATSNPEAGAPAAVHPGGANGKLRPHTVKPGG
jgi:subtilase family serine protease